MAVVPITIPVVRDVRAVLGRARESIHLQKSYERTRPRRRTRTAGGQRSSRSSSNVDEHVRRRIRRPAKEARPTNLERALARVSLDGRHLGPGKVGRIDVDRLEQAQTIGIRALAFRPVVGKGVKGLDLAELPFAEKATALSPTKVLRHESWWPVDPKPATCRQARGRWRLNDRKVVQRGSGNEGGNAAFPRRPSKSDAGGFSHGTGQAVSKSGARSRVPVTRNVGCRSGIEAP